MPPLPSTATDPELITFVDRWASLLEKEEYLEAYQLTDHDPDMHWTPELIRKVIKSYGKALPTQRVTLAGEPTDIAQRKEVTRWPQNRRKGIGQVWYDLNINGFASDPTDGAVSLNSVQGAQSPISKSAISILTSKSPGLLYDSGGGQSQHGQCLRRAQSR